MNVKIVYFLWLLLFIDTQAVFAATFLTPTTTATPPNIGIFALPTSQQPATFYSFGQTLINKDMVQLYIYPSYLKLPSQRYSDLTNYLVYGLTDTTSFMLIVPYALSYQHNEDHSAGFADTGFQLEHALFTTTTKTYTEQATILGALSIPTGSLRKFPHTGFGAKSYLVGATYNRSYVQWFWFVSPFIDWVDSGDHVHAGSQYLYQGGIGHNIKSEPKRYIFSGLLELDGEYAQRSKLFHFEEPNTGGNVIFLTPSLLYSTPKVQTEVGFSIPVWQQWNGNQSRINYFVAASIGINLT